MFGMEKDKEKKTKKGISLFEFDLEKDLAEMEKQKEHARHIQERITQIKYVLRKGSKKEEYDQLGILLNGYHALAVVLGRVVKQNK